MKKTANPLPRNIIKKAQSKLPTPADSPLMTLAKLADLKRFSKCLFPEHKVIKGTLSSKSLRSRKRLMRVPHARKNSSKIKSTFSK